MKPKERTLLYSFLSLLIALNIVLLFGRTNRTAWAEPTPWQDALGPADSLTLIGPSGSDELVLSNDAGRLSFGDNPYHKSYSVAFVHIGKIVGQLMQNEAYQEERDRLIAEFEPIDRDYIQRIEAIRQRGAALDPESEEAVRVFEEYRELIDEHGRWRQEAVARQGKLDAKHLEQSYRELLEGVGVVAEQRGIDLVYRFIPPDDAFDAENPEQAMHAMRMRTVLRAPDALDITDAVLEELSLSLE